MKTAKAILKKCRDAGEDVNLALLAWRNTPSEGFATSPAQRLMSRRTRTPLPTAPALLQPCVDTRVQEQLTAARLKQKKYYDRGAKTLKPISVGDTVRIQPTTLGDDEWKLAKCIAITGPRQYLLKTENGK